MTTDMTRTAKCGECLAIAHYPKKHDSTSGPLSIRRTGDCSQRDGAPTPAEVPLVDQVRETLASVDDRSYLNPFYLKVMEAYLAVVDDFDSLVSALAPTDGVLIQEGHEIP